MRPRDLADLLLLAALWGASFLFMRVAAPAFGPVALMEVRVAVAAACLLPLLLARRRAAVLRARLAPIAVIGVINSALPFVLFAYAMLTVTAGFASILNATAPMWAAFIGWLWLREKIRAAQWAGLAVGIAGVTVLLWGKVSLQPDGTAWTATLAIAAALIASLSYGAAANYAKRRLAGVDASVIAAGSQFGAAIVLLPFAVAFWPAHPVAVHAWLMAVALGVACTALAYLLYFRLIDQVGALRAASVTFLVPLFAVIWGAAFLGEGIDTQMALGGAIILLGTALALGLVGAPRIAVAASGR